jgi:hypothetical protein
MPLIRDDGLLVLNYDLLTGKNISHAPFVYIKARAQNFQTAMMYGYV